MGNYSLDRKPLPDRMHDDRVKITEEQKEIAKQLRTDGKSFRYIADYLSVSPSDVYYICNPGKYEQKLVKDVHAQRGKKVDKVKHNESVKKLRIKKRRVFTNNAAEGKVSE